MTDGGHPTQVARVIGSRDRVEVIARLPAVTGGTAWALVRDLHNSEPPYWLEGARLSSFRDAAELLRRIAS